MSFFNRVKTILEAATQASEKAKQMGLKSDGHGDYYDKQGKLVAKTVGGNLKFFGNRPGGGEPMTDTAAKMVPEPQKKPEQKPEQEKTKKTGETITVGFGRFNPPTVGHEKLLNTISQTAGKGGQYRIYPSRSEDPKKNPLPAGEKVQYMRKAFPKHANAIVDDEKTRNIFDVLKAADAKGYSSVNIVVGSDRVKEFENLANKYNGKLYNFDKINIVNAGKRDANAKGVEGMSASKLRQAVIDGDYAAFRSGFEVRNDEGEVERELLDDKSSKQLFNTLRKRMNVKSEGWEVAPKLFPQSLREHFITKKLFQVGSWVENMNHGLIGEVTRRGANHVIAVTKEGIMFKSWLRDLIEVYEIGTDAYRDHAVSITPGQKYPFINKIRQNLRKSRKR
jgi:hypothetical protein